MPWPKLPGAHSQASTPQKCNWKTRRLTPTPGVTNIGLSHATSRLGTEGLNTHLPMVFSRVPERERGDLARAPVLSPQGIAS